MNLNLAPIGLGWIIALIVLVIAVALILLEGNARWLDFVAALALARLLP